MSLCARHTGVNTSGAFKGAGRPQVCQTDTVVLLQQRHYTVQSENIHHYQQSSVHVASYLIMYKSPNVPTSVVYIQVWGVVPQHGLDQAH